MLTYSDLEKVYKEAKKEKADQFYLINGKKEQEAWINSASRDVIDFGGFDVMARLSVIHCKEVGLEEALMIALDDEYHKNRTSWKKLNFVSLENGKWKIKKN